LPLRRAYNIITEELKGEGTGINKDMALQMAVKAINGTAGPNGIVPTLLFSAYPRLSEYDPPTPSTTPRASAIRRQCRRSANYGQNDR
jgi:hypothetical protein